MAFVLFRRSADESWSATATATADVAALALIQKLADRPVIFPSQHGTTGLRGGPWPCEAGPGRAGVIVFRRRLALSRPFLGQRLHRPSGGVTS